MPEFGEMKQSQRRTFQYQSRQRAIGVDTSQGDERSNILNSLSKFASTGSAEATRQVRAEIETKKALGASRAAQDLIKTEEQRQGITDDDVLATKLSYNAIVGQHDTMEAGNSFVEWYRANPEASDSDIENKKTELYQPLFEQYGGDEQSVKQISLQVQESQFGLSAVQEKIKQGYRIDKNTEALTMSVGDMLSDPNVDVASMIGDSIPTQAKALGLDEFAYKKVLMQEMSARASEGDARLMNQLSKVNWAKDSALLDKAKTNYHQHVAKENAVAIGDAMGSIEIENKSLTVPWNTTLRKIDQLNKRFPNTYSSVRIASLKQQRQAAIKTDKTNTGMLQQHEKNKSSEDSIPLGLDTQYTPKELTDHVKYLEGSWAKKSEELQESGQFNKEEVNAAILKQKLDWSRTERVPVPSLKKNLEGLINLNPEDYPNSKELPEYATSAFNILKTMDSTMIGMYFSNDKDKAMAMNIKQGMSTRDDYSAYKRAFNVKMSPYNPSFEKREDLAIDLETAVSDKLTHTFSIIGFGKDAPDWQQAHVLNKVTPIANTNMHNGVIDTEENAKQSVAEYLKDTSQTFNGSLINKPKATLAKGMSTSDYNVPVEKVDGYVESFVLANSDLIKEEWGSEVDSNDISLDVNETGTSFVMRYKGGEQIGGRFNLQDISTVGRKANLKDLRELVTKTQAELTKQRKEEAQAAEEAAHMALFYKEWYESTKKN